MPLLSFDPDYRRVWMFPRNIRSIYPWKIAQILSLLYEQTNFENWQGNTSLQRSFCKALERAKLKRAGEQIDPNSGGSRTYLSQLECLGLTYSVDGQLYLTKSGEDIVNGQPPLPIIQRLILRHQYPSSYALGYNVKIDPRMKIKPFLFVLQMLRDSRIKYLTIEEIIIPVVYGHNHDNLDLCIQKVLELRNGRHITEVINNPRDIYTRRNTSPDLQRELSINGNIHDIANTCKNYLQATCLVSPIRIGNKNAIICSPSAVSLIDNEIRRLDSFFVMPSPSQANRREVFQLRYGSWDLSRDTTIRRITDTHVNAGELTIRGLFFEHLGCNILTDYPEDFVQDLVSGFGFTESQVRATIEPYLSKNLDIFESTYLELSTSGTKEATSFEKATCEIFKKSFKFDAKHTGQMRRPNGVGGYADVFIVALDNQNCAVVDTKASPCYTLSSDDYLRMTSNYIQNYRELCNDRELSLEFCMYVAGGFGSIENKLQEILRETRINASAITAVDFLRLAKEKNINDSNQPTLRNIFKNTRILNYSEIDF